MNPTIIEKYNQLPNTARLLIRVTYFDPDEKERILKSNEYAVEEITSNIGNAEIMLNSLVSILLKDYNERHPRKDT